MSTNVALNSKVDMYSLRFKNMEAAKVIESDRQRAEVFDALGHPTRIAILKALQEDAAGFAELKKKTSIESSGHLQHHLNKLDGLIKTDEYGKYCLSDQGKDALVTVQTVENASATKETRVKTHSSKGKKGTKSVAVVLAALLIVSSAFAVFQYSQIATLQREIDRIGEVNFDAMAYYSEFGVIPATNVNASFAPPVSMYRALQIALQNDGWNKTSLNGMRVGAYLAKWQAITEQTYFDSATWEPITIDITSRQLTAPPTDYSPVYSNGIVYRYVWQIIVQGPSGITIPPIGFSLVDAATGEIVPKPLLF
jgi:DNA-binding HxlR family transcriptional regulator